MTYEDELQAQLIQQALDKQKFEFLNIPNDIAENFIMIGVDPSLLLTIFSAVFAGVLLALLAYKSICLASSLLIGRFLPTSIVVKSLVKVSPKDNQKLNPGTEGSYAK